MEAEWTHLKEEYVQLRDDVAKQTKELTDCEASVTTLEHNFGSTPEVATLRIQLEAKKLVLHKKVTELDKMHDKIQTIGKDAYTMMKEQLRIYNDVLHTLSNDTQWVDEQNKVAVEIAKITYSNLKDNYQLRSDPDIAGVTKSDPMPCNSSNVALDTFFLPLCDTKTLKERMEKLYDVHVEI